MASRSSQINPTIKELRLFCPYCILNNKRSRRFSSVYSLKYHLYNIHKDENTSEYTTESLQNVIQNLEKAIKLGMIKP